jgi:SAM-dependent MidA family methyltransferase
MGSSTEFRKIFAAEPDAQTGVGFARFCELALYHPAAGYYTAARVRVGSQREADFKTATTVGPVFGELVAAAAERLLGPGRAAEHDFIEIGAEPGGGILRDRPHPFRSYRTIRYGQAYEFTERCVVFSNELFDAQPFARVVAHGGAWRELGVALRDAELVEVEMPAPTAETAAFLPRLPAAAGREGYVIDLPLRTEALLARIVAPAWRGLFLAFDYGRTWRELAEEIPGGSARSYYRHKMGTDLLARPGEQDITCHVCWDWLEDGLRRAGFGEPVTESQESFLVRYAGGALEAITASDAGRVTARKRAAMQLIHPGNMGQKFQALHALRK